MAALKWNEWQLSSGLGGSFALEYARSGWILYGQGGKIFTTIDAINAAMGLKFDIPDANQEVIDFID